VLQGVPAHYGLTMSDGRQVAGAAGSWQLGRSTDNAHAWFVGYSAHNPAGKANGLAVAVWVGNKAEEQKIVDRNGRSILGGSLPGPIWRDFLDGALTALKTPAATCPGKQNTGTKQLGTGIPPTS
jgi:membrane peptidoglycan carboxypeptidase